MRSGEHSHILNTRIGIVAYIMCFCAIVLIARLYYIQIHQHEHYSTLAEKTLTRTVNPLSERGSIYFRTLQGDIVSAATNRRTYALTIDPSRIIDAQALYEILSSIVVIDQSEFISKATKVDDQYELITRRINDETALRIESLNIKGVNIETQDIRTYPGDSLASHVIGIAGYKGSEYAGRYGLELSYNDTLIQKDARKTNNPFAHLFGVISVGKKDSSSANVITTIEPTVQRMTEDSLVTMRKTWGADKGGMIVMDPVTGDVIAMAAFPDFNVNDTASFRPEILRNPLVEDTYEMGSIFKPLTIAAGIESGSITRDSTFRDMGSITIDGRRISNVYKQARGVVNMQTVLNSSMNTGVAYIVDRMGIDKFRTSFINYGFASSTGIDLPNEARNQIKNLDSGRMIEYATASFGQGIALTPISITRALASLANGGYLVTPRIVREIEYDNNTHESIISPEPVRILSTTTSEVITDMLINLVDVALLGGKYRNSHYTIAAKTGTAQMVDPNQGGYYEDRYLHSFFGYFPATKPRFIIFIYHIYPKNANYASETLTEPFMNMVDFLTHYYNIPPDR